jgi:hypothetical protein
MCCIISMLGPNAHMNAYITHVEIIYISYKRKLH